jgi:hypothetical protein
MNEIEKWVCGPNLAGQWVVRQVFVRETPSMFIVDPSKYDDEINWLLGHGTRFSRRQEDCIFFNSAREAVRDRINSMKQQIETLNDTLEYKQTALSEITLLLNPR